MLTQGPRGTQDILPEESYRWQYLERLIRQICREYGYREIRTPIFEHTELFLRGVGDTTDIVEKEMYSFKDRGDRDITLRPEGTAGTVRAYVQHKLYAEPAPQKVFYIGPMFRYGRPQAGRLRQFHQFGIEAFGASDPLMDAEVITLAMDFYRRLGLKNLELLLNSVGCPVCRPAHRQALQDYLRPRLADLCELCRGRFERNPMRILDCKNEKCQEASQGAPTTTRCLCEECGDHLERVKSYLDAAGIAYTIDERLVRGLDYYTKTAFEIVTTDIGAQSSIGGGGRYDGLVAEVGGPSTQGIGFGLGLERILLTMANQGIEIANPYSIEVFIATVGQEAEVKAKAFSLATELRQKGLSVELDYSGKSLKAQMKSADRHKANHVIIMGGEELRKGMAVIRSMENGEQAEMPLEQIAGHLLATW